MATTDREKRLIERFVGAYNTHRAAAFQITAWPDELDSTGKAVDALAADAANGQIAIELTLLQPFVNERADSHIFEKTVGSLDGQKDLLLPDFDVDLSFRVGAVPKGVDWNCVAPTVEGWYLGNRDALPTGFSTQRIPGLSFDLDVNVQKEPAPGSGHLFISRTVPAESVDPVVRRALDSKLPKLVAAEGDIHLLLLEKNSLPRGNREIGEAIEKLRPEIAELAKTDEVWLVNTVAWDSEDYTPSYLIWPLDRAVEFQEQRAAKRG